MSGVWKHGVSRNEQNFGSEISRDNT